MPLLDARDTELDEPRVIESPRPLPRKLLFPIDNCLRPRDANPLGPLLDPRPLKPRLNTVLGVRGAAKWVGATKTADFENRAYCAASVRVFGAFKITRLFDNLLLKPFVNCLMMMCSSITKSAAFGQARCPINLTSRANDSILSLSS